MFIEETKNGIVFMRSDVIPFRHGFMTRYGGVSTGDFASLNLGSNRGDDPVAVRENYRRLCELFGSDENGCCVTKQVHGNCVKHVTSEDRHENMGKVPYEADGIVTTEKHLPLMCFTADCVPALAADRRGNCCAAVHCGWRSSVADILGVMIDKMTALGAEKDDICVAFGPSIGSCCFETDIDVSEAISEYLGGDIKGIWKEQDDGKFLVDLRAANARRLLQLGIPEGNIDISDECTVCSHDKYWSNRYTLRHGLGRGNLASVIVIE